MNPPRKRGWVNKFKVAGQGLLSGIRGQSSFLVHVPATILVVVLIGVLRLSVERSVLLLFCVGIVWIAELFNTAIEILVRKLHPEQDQEIGRALDVAAASVLVASITAAVCGGWILLLAVWHG